MAVIFQETIHTEFDRLVTVAEKHCERRDPEALKTIALLSGMAEISGSAYQLTLVSYINAYHDCFVANKYDAAIKRLSDCLATLDEELLARVGYKFQMTLGNAYQLKGELFSSQENYLSGLRGLENKADLTITEKEFLAAFYLNLSVILGSSELDIEAQEYLDNAIGIYSELDNKYKLGLCRTAYAQILEKRADNHGAFQQMKMALKMYEEIKNEYSIALAKANLGILAIKVGQFENSYTYVVQAFEFYEKKKLRYETALIKLELGRALMQTNRPDEALIYLTGAETIFKLTGNKRELSDIYRAKADVFTQQGQHMLANKYLEKYIGSLKFFFNNEKINALTRAKNEFETEQKEQEAKLLREKNDEIQQYVHKLEASNNELQQFAHAASHDLREPLRMINNFTSLLKNSMGDSVTKQQGDFIGFVLDGTKRMEQLIQGMLALSKVGANPKVERVNLNAVLQEVRMNLNTLIKEKHVIIDMDELPIIDADHTQMIQLFQNLIANGILYNRSKTPRISIIVKANGKLEISVCDNGIGIPEKSRDIVFGIFNRLDKNDGTGGSGIGLSICKKIVDKMNGKITVLTGKEGGTIMRISLPRKIAQ